MCFNFFFIIIIIIFNIYSYCWLGISYYVEDVTNFLKRKYLHVPLQVCFLLFYVIDDY